MTIRALTLGWVGLVAAVACACSSPPSANPTSISTPQATHAANSAAASAPTSAPTSAAPPLTPASASQLTGIVLKSSDLPTGWTGTAYKPDPHAGAVNAAFAKCLGVRNTGPDQVADVHSRTFTMSHPYTTIDSEATSYRSASDLAVDRAALSSPNYASCNDKVWRTALAQVLPAGVTIGGITTTVTEGPAGGPGNVIGAVSTTIILIHTDTGIGVPSRAWAVFAFGPLIEAAIYYIGVVPADLQTKLLNLVATRAARG